MSRRTEAFRAARDQLLADHPERVFVCRCSRRQLDGAGWCAAGCLAGGVRLEPGRSAVRLRVAPATRVRIGPDLVAVPEGDHILWRRDDLAAYQLGSVVVDEELGVTTLVRGIDLLESSAFQVHLAELLPAPGFRVARMIHHDLLTAADGTKLSKSAGSQSAPMKRTWHLRERVLTLAKRLGAQVGIQPD
jgi:glutamyl/glutaminyl-tRNA synthetase